MSRFGPSLGSIAARQCHEQFGEPELQSAEPTRGDLKLAESVSPSGEIRESMRRRFPAPRPTHPLVDQLIDLHTPRQLAGLHAILTRIDDEERPGAVTATLRLALLHAVILASRLNTSRGKPAPIRISNGSVKVPTTREWRERNPWLAFEDGLKLVKTFVQKLEAGTPRAAMARLGPDLASLESGTPNVTLVESTPAALRRLGLHGERMAHSGSPVPGSARSGPGAAPPDSRAAGDLLPRHRLALRGGRGLHAALRFALPARAEGHGRGRGARTRPQPRPFPGHSVAGPGQQRPGGDPPRRRQARHPGRGGPGRRCRRLPPDRREAPPRRRLQRGHHRLRAPDGRHVSRRSHPGQPAAAAAGGGSRRPGDDQRPGTLRPAPEARRRAVPRRRRGPDRDRDRRGGAQGPRRAGLVRAHAGRPPDRARSVGPARPPGPRAPPATRRRRLVCLDRRLVRRELRGRWPGRGRRHGGRSRGCGSARPGRGARRRSPGIGAPRDHPARRGRGSPRRHRGRAAGVDPRGAGSAQQPAHPPDRGRALLAGFERGPLGRRTAHRRPRGVGRLLAPLLRRAPHRARRDGADGGPVQGPGPAGRSPHRSLPAQLQRPRQHAGGGRRLGSAGEANGRPRRRDRHTRRPGPPAGYAGLDREAPAGPRASAGGSCPTGWTMPSAQSTCRSSPGLPKASSIESIAPGTFAARRRSSSRWSGRPC